VVASRTGGHTAGHSVVRLASGGDRLTFAGDAVFQVGFDRPDWHNGFEHDSEETARVRVRLLRELVDRCLVRRRRIFAGLSFGSSTASRSIISRPRRTGLWLVLRQHAGVGALLRIDSAFQRRTSNAPHPAPPIYEYTT
jgi:metallo-beta-lactamase superfamily protein